MTHGSLFSGIGGFDLAAEWMGWENLFHCEIEPFPQKILKHYWPDAELFTDIKTADFSAYADRIDVLTGGFPCQPYSTAGKRLGKEDERHLWPYMLRAIQQIKPRWVVGENVFGLVNWSGGLVFHEVQADLEAAGYEVQPYVLPACGVNAPHKRDRVWFVAYNNGKFWGERRQHKSGKQSRYGEGFSETTPNAHNTGGGDGLGEVQSKDGEVPQRNNDAELGNASDGAAADTVSIGLAGKEYREKKSGLCCENSQIPDWHNFPTQPPIRGKYDGVSDWMVRHIKPEIYASISERYTEQDLQKVWECFQSEEVRQQIGRLYEIHEPGILLQVVQLCSPSCTIEKGTSVFSKETSEALLRKLQKHETFANTPQGRELEKQFTEQFGNSLPYLSHEIALVAMEVEGRTVSAYSKWRNESIKGYGNAVVPQVVYQIFKSIQQYELCHPTPSQVSQDHTKRL